MIINFYTVVLVKDIFIQWYQVEDDIIIFQHSLIVNERSFISLRSKFYLLDKQYCTI